MEEVIKCKYTYGYDFHEGLALVQNDQYLCGYIDCEGKEIVPFKYTHGSDFHEGLALVRNNQFFWGYINKEGKEISQFKYVYGSDFQEGMAAVQNFELLFGFIDKKGKEIIPCQYDDVYDFHEGLSRVKKGGKWIYINTNGDELIHEVNIDSYEENKKTNEFSNSDKLDENSDITRNSTKIKVKKKY